MIHVDGQTDINYEADGRFAHAICDVLKIKRGAFMSRKCVAISNNILCS